MTAAIHFKLPDTVILTALLSRVRFARRLQQFVSDLGRAVASILADENGAQLRR